MRKEDYNIPDLMFCVVRKLTPKFFFQVLLHFLDAAAAHSGIDDVLGTLLIIPLGTSFPMERRIRYYAHQFYTATCFLPRSKQPVRGL